MSNYIIKRVEITDFDNNRNLALDLHEHANIIIGRNGSGKTRLINLIQAALDADPYVLANIDFNEISLILFNRKSRSTRKITLSRVYSEYGDIQLSYKLSQRSYKLTIPYRMLDSEASSTLARRRFLLAFEELRKELKSIITMSAISVYRESTYYHGDDLERDRMIKLSPVDRRILNLIEKLRGYQLELSSSAAEESSKFQKNALSLMLWDMKLDTFSSLEDFPEDFDEQRQGLIKAYKDLDAYNSGIQKKIDSHIEAIKLSIEKVRNMQNDLSVDDVSPLPLLRRTKIMIDIAKATEEKRKKIFQPITLLREIISEYFIDKNVRISKDGRIIIESSGSEIKILDLSSGEKQVLILLIEVLLQKEEIGVFLADEPELSLHIEWQERIVPDIFKLNPNAQLIAATHSPEVNSYKQKTTFNMAKLIKNG